MPGSMGSNEMNFDKIKEFEKTITRGNFEYGKIIALSVSFAENKFLLCFAMGNFYLLVNKSELKR